jgi:hypothetical protein
MNSQSLNGKERRQNKMWEKKTAVDRKVSVN